MVNRGGVRAVAARSRSAVLLFLLAFGGIALLRHDLSRLAHSRPAHFSLAQAQARLTALPLAFEPNKGQTASQVKFLAHGAGYGLFLTSSEAVLAFPPARKNSTSAALHMTFAGATGNGEVTALQPLVGRTNYFLGNDPSKWVRNVPQFARVQYRDVYPGVDLDFYGKQGRVEYDFEVNPGADPGNINLRFSDAKNLRIAANGDLVIGLADRELRFQAPHLYQRSAVGDYGISGNFILRAKDEVGFQVGDYDRSRALVIDPVLTFSTYFGGSGGESCAVITGAQFVPHCPAVALDSANRIYLAGATTSASGFPTPTSPINTFEPGGAGTSNVFVARISNTGSALALDFLTFIGGTGTDYPVGVAVDSGFNVYVAGNTSSGNFPTTPEGFQTSTPASGNHVFFTELNPSFGGPVYSTFLAGNGVDTASDMALDNQGRAYIFGTTTSTTSSVPFPTTIGSLQQTALATNQFFFSKLNPNLNGPNSLLYSTFIGGSAPANGVVMGGGIALDANLNVYLAGGTNFSDMPLVNAFQGTEQGGLDVWAAKLSAPANNTQQYTPAYETYFGGTGDEVAYGVASDSSNTNMYIAGSTTSATLPAASGSTPLQPTYGGGTSDAFLAKFGGVTTTGTTQGNAELLYFTYLGGAGQDVGLSVVADTSQNAYMAGLTTSGPLTNSNPLFQSPGGGTDAFFARILTTTISSTNTGSTSILGGSGTDIGTSVALDTGLNSYIAGETTSADFPHTSDPVVPNVAPLQASLAGTSDAFVSKIGPNFSGLSFVCTASGCPTPAPANPTVNPSPVGVGGTVTFTYSIYNFGDPVSGAVFTDNVGLPQNSTISTASANPGSCAVGGGASVVCDMSTIPTSVTGTATSSAAQVTITVTASVPSPTTPPTKPPAVGNSAVLSVAGTTFQTTTSGSATVNDFNVSAGPNAQTITAGNEGTYTVVVTPTGIFPGSVSLSCGPLPSGTQCQFQGTNPITTLNNGAQNRILDITTTPRVTTPASLFRSGPIYAFWLPVSGFALIGSGFSRRRRWLMAILIAVLLGGVALQAGCSNSSNTSTTTGTPAGSYTITLNATSGGATRTTAVTLNVQ